MGLIADSFCALFLQKPAAGTPTNASHAGHANAIDEESSRV